MDKNVISILFLILAFLIFGVWTLPAYKGGEDNKGVKELIQEQNVFKKLVEDSLEIQNIRQQLVDKYSAIDSSDKEKLYKLFPAEADVSGLIVQFERLPQDHGLILTNLSITDTEQNKKRRGSVAEQKKQTHQAVGIDLNILGTYDNFFSFLQSLEKSLRIIDVTSIGFLVGEASSYQFNIGLQAYTRIPTDDPEIKIDDLPGVVAALKNLQIDDSFFQSPILTGLVDFSKDLIITEAEKGRPNPFLPI